MFIPDYEAGKKEDYGMEEKYLVHGDYPLFIFRPNLALSRIRTLASCLTLIKQRAGQSKSWTSEGKLQIIR